MSPTYQGLVYGDAVEISVHTMEGGWGPKTESENKTAVKVSGNSIGTIQVQVRVHSPIPKSKSKVLL